MINLLNFFKMKLLYSNFFVLFRVFHCGAYLSSQIDQEATTERLLVQVYFEIFFVSFLISLSYRPFKRGRRSGPSNIALGCSRPGVPIQEGNECNFITTVGGSDLTFSQFIVWV